MIPQTVSQQSSMKHLAIDFGKKRLGLAISDNDARIAVPYEVRERRGLKHDVAELLQTARALRVERVVFGLPRETEGDGVHHAEQVRGLARALQNAFNDVQMTVEIAWWDERFSTAEALGNMRTIGISARQGRESVDAHAASVILQGYLDAQRRSENFDGEERF